MAWGTCPSCGRPVHIRLDGQLRKHRKPGSKYGCLGDRDKPSREAFMENPATWKPADKIVNDAYGEWAKAMDAGMIGPSIGRYIADQLRKAGIVQDDEAASIGWEGVRDEVTDAAALAALDAWYGGRWDGKGGRGTVCRMKDAVKASRNPPEPEPGRTP